MKFSLADFRKLDLPDLLINIWNYSGCNNINCSVCNQYRYWCVQDAYEKKPTDFKDFRGVIDNMKIQTKSWFDVGKLRNNSKNDLYNAISKWHVKCRVSGKWKSFMN